MQENAISDGVRGDLLLTGVRVIDAASSCCHRSRQGRERVREMTIPAKRRSASARAVKAYEVKVTLLGIRPPVWRRITVRSDMRLKDLHSILQMVMGWTDSHMHAFQPLGGRGKIRATAPVERNQERRTRLDDFLRKPKDRMIYEYDFADSWEHELLLEKAVAHRPGARYPWVLGGARACPPEDIGTLNLAFHGGWAPRKLDG